MYPNVLRYTLLLLLQLLTFCITQEEKTYYRTFEIVFGGEGKNVIKNVIEVSAEGCFYHCFNNVKCITFNALRMAQGRYTCELLTNQRPCIGSKQLVAMKESSVFSTSNAKNCVADTKVEKFRLKCIGCSTANTYLTIGMALMSLGPITLEDTARFTMKEVCHMFLHIFF